MVLDDKAAGEAEKNALLSFIGQVPEPLTEKFQADIRARIEAAGGDTNKIWARGGASFGDRHMRDEQSMNIIRYDIFYDQLTPEQRAVLEKSFNTYIQFHLDGHKPWHADFSYGQMTWLPNMSWPRAIGTHLIAVGLKDEKKIDATVKSGVLKYTAPASQSGT